MNDIVETLWTRIRSSLGTLFDRVPALEVRLDSIEGELDGYSSAASASAAAAKTSETAAKASQTAAKTSETNAASSKSAAASSASAAKASETTVAASASAAATSEANAKTSETNAKTSETAAKASQTAAKTSETNAASSKSAAASSASAANTSKNAAATSAAAAKTSETNAKTSETNAKASETNAKASETTVASSATAAKTSETNAKASETAAASSKSAAASSASAANTSKNAAATSAAAAKTSETNAANSAAAAANSAASITNGAEVATLKAAEASASADRAEAASSGKADLVGGKVPTSQIPEVALTKPSQVTSRAAMLALKAQEGDIAIITTGADKGTYILGTGSPTVFASWMPMAVSSDVPVQSVNGQVGTVVLSATDVGAAPTSHTHTSAQISDATSSATANKVVKRDSNGNFLVGTPTATTHPASKSYVDDQVATKANATHTHVPSDIGASFAATANSIPVRDSGGRLAAMPPVAPGQVATKLYVDNRPALFSGAGKPPSTIAGAVVGDWWLNTTTMELFKITGV